MTGKKQAVKIGNYLSEPIEMSCEIPQGSSCSCLLFILYIGDFGQWTMANHSIYADDIMITCYGQGPSDVIKSLQEESKGVFLFCATNDLVCNPGKTAFFLISPTRRKVKQKFFIQLDGQKIEETENERMLGVILQNDLKWDQHYKKMRKRINLGLHQLKLVASCLDEKTLKTVSEGLIMSHIRYCLSVFGASFARLYNDCPRSLMLTELQRAQNKMIRIIYGLKLSNKVSTRDLLRRNGSLSINQMTVYTILLDLWKAKNFNIEPIMRHFKERTAVRFSNEYLIQPDQGRFHYIATKAWSLASKRLRNTNLIKVAETEAREFVLDGVPL